MQQPKASTADSPPALCANTSLPNLQPVVRCKASRKRKLVGTDQPRSPESADQTWVYKQGTCNTTIRCTDVHASQPATTNMHSPAQDPPAQHTATDTMCCTAVEDNKQSGLDSIPETQSSQKLQDSTLPSCTGDVHQAEASIPAAKPLSQDPEQAPSTELCPAVQTLSASPLQLPAPAEDQHNHQRNMLRKRAKSLQSEADRLLFEAQQPIPRTADHVEQDELKRIHPQRVQAIKAQLSQSAFAQAGGSGVQVPIQHLPAQAAELAQRCKGLAMRDCAVPLQDGRIMCPEARPHMASINELRRAAACQEMATAQGDL